MNTYLNYFIEANGGLCLFLLAYIFLFSKETDFSAKRLFLLMGLITSLVFPLFHFNTNASFVPAIQNYIPSYWLPEVVVGYGSGGEIATPLLNNYWEVGIFLYVMGTGLFALMFVVQVAQLIITLRNGDKRKHQRFIIIESDENKPTFSFFHYIFIGRKHEISEQEKAQIIIHEQVHGNCYHSFDILLFSMVRIFFWFNPVLMTYKKIFVQLHEFEADARAVENRDVDDYCSLLARVALKSADFKIANHFNNSLTVKRINMIRTIKRKIQWWKIAAGAAILPLFFFAIACQDQVADDLASIAKNSNAAVVVPDNVQKRYDELKAKNPTGNYILVQINDEGMKTLKELDERYGLPKSMEIFKPEGKSEAEAKDESYAIMEFTEQVKEITKAPAADNVFTVVEEMPKYNGGNTAMGEFLSSNIHYPKASLKAGVTGTVFTQFIINTDGSISDVTVIKGIDKFCDEEAVRVVKSMQNWIPGKQNGKEVRVRFVVPIKFAS
jgi:TonB family protein